MRRDDLLMCTSVYTTRIKVGVKEFRAKLPAYLDAMSPVVHRSGNLGGWTACAVAPGSRVVDTTGAGAYQTAFKTRV